MEHVIEMAPFDLRNTAHIHVIDQLSEWTGEPGGALLLNERRVISHPHKFVAFDTTEGALAGYIAITAEYRIKCDTMPVPIPSCVQIGALVVSPALRGKGVGPKLAEYLLGNIPELIPKAELIIAFVNDKSRKIFEGLGAKAVGNKSVYWYKYEGIFLPRAGEDTTRGDRRIEIAR